MSTMTQTGTLTKDEISLHHHVDCSGNPSRGVFQLAYLNAVCQGANGNSIDSAILDSQTGQEHIGNPYHEKVAEIPFTFERRRSSCIVQGVEKKPKLICKGAYDEVLALCTNLRSGEKNV